MGEGERELMILGGCISRSGIFIIMKSARRGNRKLLNRRIICVQYVVGNGRARWCLGGDCGVDSGIEALCLCLRRVVDSFGGWGGFDLRMYPTNELYFV